MSMIWDARPADVSSARARACADATREPGHAERGAASDSPFPVPSARIQQVQTMPYDHATLLLNLNSRNDDFQISSIRLKRQVFP